MRLDAFFGAIAKRPWPVLALWLVVVFGSMPFVATVQRDFSVEAYFPKEDGVRAEHARFSARFPGEDATVVAFVAAAGTVGIDAATVDIVEQVAAAFSDAGLVQVRHLASTVVLAPVQTPEGEMVLPRRLLERGADDAAVQEAVARALRDPLLRGVLIDNAGHTLAVLGELTPEDDVESGRARLEHQLTAAVAQLDPAGRVALTGLPILRARYLTLMAADQAVYVGASILLCFGLLFLLYRSIRQTFAVLLGVLPATVVTIAALSLLHRPMTALTSVVPVILLVVGLSDSTHLLVEVRRRVQHGDAVAAAIAAAFGQLALPCLATAVTTSIGFFALASTGIDIVVDFAVVAGAAILVMWAANMLFMPALLALWPARMKRSTTKDAVTRLFDAVVKGSLAAAHRWPRAIVVGTAVAVAVAVWGMAGLVVDTRMIDERASHPLVADIRAAEAKGFGLFQVNVFIEPLATATPPTRVVDREMRAWMASLSRAFPQQHSISLHDVIEHGFVAFFPGACDGPAGACSLGETGALFDAGMVEQLTHDPSMLASARPLYDPASGTAQVLFFVDDAGSLQQQVFIDALQRFIHDHPPPGATASVTGTVVLAQGTFSRLVDGFVRSLAWATGLIFLVMLWQFRSLRFAVLGLVPNVVPLVLVVGGTALLGYPLTPTLVLVISIATGLVVDDTIHLHSTIRALRLAGKSWQTATDVAVVERGPAVLQTGVVITGAFLCLTLSTFHGTFLMGALLALSMVVGTVVELVCFPAAVICFASDAGDASTPSPAAAGETP